MTDRPYTDDDLRAEAARQHAGLTEDPDYMGIGEAMDDDIVPSTETGRRKTWARLLPYGDAFDIARTAIHNLVTRAADTSRWAVDLGADGLEPAEHSITVGPDNPACRIHFAFAPEMTAQDRAGFVNAIARRMDRDGTSTTCPTASSPGAPPASRPSPRGRYPTTGLGAPTTTPTRKDTT